MDEEKEIEKLEKQAAVLAKRAEEAKAKAEKAARKAEEIKQHKDLVFGKIVRKKLGNLNYWEGIYLARFLEQFSDSFDDMIANANGETEPAELKIFDDPNDRAKARAGLKKLLPDEESEEKTDTENDQPEEKNSAPTGEQTTSDDGQTEENKQPAGITSDEIKRPFHSPTL